MPSLADVDWLRARVEAGATAREIADEVGQTHGTVRGALHRHGLRPAARSAACPPARGVAEQVYRRSEIGRRRCGVVPTP